MKSKEELTKIMRQIEEKENYLESAEHTPIIRARVRKEIDKLTKELYK